MLLIDELIKEKMKAREQTELSALKMLKAKIQEWKTAKGNIGKEYTEEVEISLIKKMRDEYIEDSETYAKKMSGDSIWAKSYKQCADYLSTLLPAEVTREQVEDFAKTVVTAGDKKNMGNYIKQIKEHFIGVDGKMVADVVKSLL